MYPEEAGWWEEEEERYRREMSRRWWIRDVSVRRKSYSARFIDNKHVLSTPPPQCADLPSTRHSLPPLCFPHLRINSPQLSSVPFGAVPGFASAHAPRRSAPVSAAW